MRHWRQKMRSWVVSDAVSMLLKYIDAHPEEFGEDEFTAPKPSPYISVSHKWGPVMRNKSAFTYIERLLINRKLKVILRKATQERILKEIITPEAGEDFRIESVRRVRNLAASMQNTQQQAAGNILNNAFQHQNYAEGFTTTNEYKNALEEKIV